MTKSNKRFLAVLALPAGGVTVTRVRAEEAGDVTRRLEAAGFAVLRVQRESEVPETDAVEVERVGNLNALEHGDWSLLREAGSGNVAREWATYYARPGAGEDWLANDAAASKAREAARDALTSIRWHYQGARRAEALAKLPG